MKVNVVWGDAVCGTEVMRALRIRWRPGLSERNEVENIESSE